MLSLMVFAPLAGSIATLLFPKENVKAIRTWALVVSLIPLAVVLAMWGPFDASQAGMQFVERYEWIPSIGVSYYLGTDGVSFPLLALTALVTPLAILASFTIQQRVKEFMALMLLLETGMLGVFAALDYFLFYIFWEIVLVPMYFIIGIWGGPRREYAAIKFFIYTLAGSVIMLVGILALYFGSGLGTFDILALAEQANLSPSFQWWLFLAFFLGFAVKVPLFPFHTWLPDAHVEAPTGGSMILAGILLKMGTYGFYRISYPTFPDAAKAFSWWMGLIGVIGIVYGALVAMSQKDIKKMVAYSSISHMGFVALGLAAMTPMAMNGGYYVMISHGIISPLMFFFAGSVLYDRTHTRMIDQVKGLFSRMPVAASLFAFAAFANLGLPGLSGFVGEFFTFVGTYPVYSSLVMIAVLGMVLTAAYHLWMMQRMLMGDPAELAGGQLAAAHDHGHGHGHGGGEAASAAFRLPDITGREMAVVATLAVFTVILGILPSFLLRVTDPAVSSLVAKLGAGGV